MLCRSKTDRVLCPDIALAIFAQTSSVVDRLRYGKNREFAIPVETKAEAPRTGKLEGFLNIGLISPGRSAKPVLFFREENIKAG